MASTVVAAVTVPAAIAEVSAAAVAAPAPWARSTVMAGGEIYVTSRKWAVTDRFTYSDELGRVLREQVQPLSRFIVRD